MTRRTAKISVAGGSLSDGRATVTIRKGRPLTLQNTADGTQYELRLLWTGTGIPPKSILPADPDRRLADRDDAVVADAADRSYRDHAVDCHDDRRPLRWAS